MTTTSPADEPEPIDPESQRIIAEAEARRKLAEEESRLKRELEEIPPSLDIEAQIDAMARDCNLPDEAEALAAYEAMRKAKQESRAAGRIVAASLPERQLNKAVAGAVEIVGQFGEILTKSIAKLGKGIIIGLIGGRGTGKTQLATNLALAAITGGKSALYMTAFDFFLRVRESYRDGSKKSEREIIDELTHVDLLIMDELQERGESQWEDRLLTSLLDRRYRSGRDTVIMSNQEEAEFIAAIGPSVEDRLREGGGIAELDGESRRKA